MQFTWKCSKNALAIFWWIWSFFCSVCKSLVWLIRPWVWNCVWFKVSLIRSTDLFIVTTSSSSESRHSLISRNSVRNSLFNSRARSSIFGCKLRRDSRVLSEKKVERVLRLSVISCGIIVKIRIWVEGKNRL